MRTIFSAGIPQDKRRCCTTDADAAMPHDVSESVATAAFMGVAVDDAPPDAELLAAVALVPPDRDAPEVDEAAATSSDAAPTVRGVLSPFARRVAFALGLLFVFTIVGLVPEGLYKIAVDDFKEGVHGDADKVAITLALIGGALGVLTYVLKIMVAKINEGVLYVLRRRTFQRLSRLGIDLNRWHTGALSTRSQSW